MALRPARFLAPLALLGTIGAVMLVVNSSDKGSAGSQPDATKRSITGSAKGPAKKRVAHHYYVVKDGDVLSGIAASTGVPLARIERLNPKVDAQTLQTGQRIKLVP
jgi:LysM repeat protein